MRKSRIIYMLINVAFVVAALCFVNYEMLLGMGAEFRLPKLFLIIVLFLVVHAMRFIRMYLILLEDLILPSRFLQLYIKTTFVSSLIPFKVGELFKMYCYGMETRSASKGIIAVLIEKFFDALVLCCFMVPHALMNGSLSPLLLILLVFIVVMLAVYFSFGGTYRYLNRFLVCRGGGRKSLMALRVLEAMKKTYDEARRTLQGRFVVLVFLSLLAWGVESILIAVMNAGAGGFGFDTVFSYIDDAFFGVPNMFFNYYSCLLAVVFFVALVVIYTKKYFNIIKERKKYEINRSI